MSQPAVILTNVQAGGPINVSGVTIGFTAEQVHLLIEVANKGTDEKLAEVSRQLGVSQGAMRTTLATVGQADTPDERLPEILAEVFEQTRKAASAIAALRLENPVAREHIEQASAAASAGDSSAARLHLKAARQAAEAAAEQAQQLAAQAEAARTQQTLQAAQAAAAEAELVLAELDYLEAARLFGEAASLVPVGHPDEKGRFLPGRLMPCVARATNVATTPRCATLLVCMTGRSQNSLGSVCRSTGQRRRTTSASRFRRWATVRAGLSV